MGGSQVPMTAGLGEHRPGGQDAGAVDYPLGDQARPVRIEPSGVADGGEALLEGVLDDAPHREYVVDPREIADASRRRDQTHVNVRVGESRHQGEAGGVDHPVRRTRRAGPDTADDRTRYGHIDSDSRVVPGAVR